MTDHKTSTFVCSVQRLFSDHHPMHNTREFFPLDRLLVQCTIIPQIDCVCVQKLQRMGSGVLRLASRKTKRDLPIKASPVTNVHMSVC
jgi:hypothetical protein